MGWIYFRVTLCISLCEFHSEFRCAAIQFKDEENLCLILETPAESTNVVIDGNTEEIYVNADYSEYIGLMMFGRNGQNAYALTSEAKLCPTEGLFPDVYPFEDATFALSESLVYVDAKSSVYHFGALLHNWSSLGGHSSVLAYKMVLDEPPPYYWQQIPSMDLPTVQPSATVYGSNVFIISANGSIYMFNTNTEEYSWVADKTCSISSKKAIFVSDGEDAFLVYGYNDLTQRCIEYFNCEETATPPSIVDNTVPGLGLSEVGILSCTITYSMRLTDRILLCVGTTTQPKAIVYLPLTRNPDGSFKSMVMQEGLPRALENEAPILNLGTGQVYITTIREAGKFYDAWYKWDDSTLSFVDAGIEVNYNLKTYSSVVAIRKALIPQC